MNQNSYTIIVRKKADDIASFKQKTANRIDQVLLKDKHKLQTIKILMYPLLEYNSIPKSKLVRLIL